MAGRAVATLHGIEFKVLLADYVRVCKLAPETLALLRDRFAPGVVDSPLALFKRLFDEVMTVAAWKHERGMFEADGSIYLLVADVLQAFNMGGL
jgi:hypothetical protein